MNFGDQRQSRRTLLRTIMATAGVSAAGLIIPRMALAQAAAASGAAGVVTHLSGTLSVQRPDGSVRILSQKSEVARGDLLATQRDSYAQIAFTDGSSMTMRPETQVRVDQYTFVQERPQEDSSFLRILKGGLRTVTGLVGKRGNLDAYRIGTNTATIGIRGSSGYTLAEDAHKTFTGSYFMQALAGGLILEIPEGMSGMLRNGVLTNVVTPEFQQLLNFQYPQQLGGLMQQKPGDPGGNSCTVK